MRSSSRWQREKINWLHMKAPPTPERFVQPLSLSWISMQVGSCLQSPASMRRDRIWTSSRDVLVGEKRRGTAREGLEGGHVVKRGWKQWIGVLAAVSCTKLTLCQDGGLEIFTQGSWVEGACLACQFSAGRNYFCRESRIRVLDFYQSGEIVNTK